MQKELITKAIEEIKEAMYLLGKEGRERQVHELLASSLIKMSKCESLCMGVNSMDLPNQGKISEYSNDEIVKEVLKVKRRLPLWKNRKDQVNARILELYFRLVDRNFSEITEEMLMEEFGDDVKFKTNFSQMCNIADKNHGKVFEKKNGRIELWENVKNDVYKYFHDED